MAANRAELTTKQLMILEWMEAFAAERGRPPVIREIGGAFGINWNNGVVGHLEALEKKGHIAREAGKAGGIRFLGPKPADADAARLRALLVRCLPDLEDPKLVASVRAELMPPGAAS